MTKEDRVNFFNHIKESKDTFSFLIFKAFIKEHKILYLDSA